VLADRHSGYGARRPGARHQHGRRRPARCVRARRGSRMNGSARQPLLEVRGLSVDIHTPSGPLHAVRHVSFNVSRGETVCLVGESGCGKSITSLAVMGLLPRAARSRASRLAFDGIDLTGLGRGARNDLRGSRMAMIFQEPMTALNPAWTIGEQLIEVHWRHI